MLTAKQAIQELRGGGRIMITHPRPDVASDKTTYGLDVAAQSQADLNALLAQLLLTRMGK